MPNRAYNDTAAQLAIKQTYARIGRTQASINASLSAMATSRETISSARAMLDKISARSLGDSAPSSGADLLSTMDDEAISEMVGDFSTAYLEARDTRDETGADVIQNALKIIARYLAKELGPKEAGVVMN
ncbi:hypothetical protein MKK55_00075 [Methylobacterium sp. J-059]|uniref:hypothetical protein n=1 Tax=Methylobacterium sp. J-059 TaxID=2836643 RepID=UPI001FBA028D|nr:hypothetical protein [Methylobacterium sp. J-059]MCJ2037369.1 hypothetical protein [Methylobacterium sp. J-059]